MLPRAGILFSKEEVNAAVAQLVAGDGTTLFVDFTAAANYLPGRHALILCDVTERTRAEKPSSKEVKSGFNAWRNNIQEIFWMMDAQTHEIAVHPAPPTPR